MVKSWLGAKIKELYPDVAFDILTPPNPKMGDYSVNLPFILAKAEKKNPADVGKEISAKLSENKEFKKYFSKIEFAAPGFINFYLSVKFLKKELAQVLKKKEKYGSSKKKKYKINLEFVSANPTGPLTMANGRGGFLGNGLANILRKAGFDVSKEYYINDTGRQIAILGDSVAIAAGYKEISEYGDDLYRGGYIQDLAKELTEKGIFKNRYEFPEEIGERASKLLLDKIKNSLENAGIAYDKWVSENKNLKDEDYQRVVDKLWQAGFMVADESGGYVFKSQGNEEKRFLIRSAGTENMRNLSIGGGNKHEYSSTYFLSDLVYHYNKFVTRKFDRCINIWGADHHGYVERIKNGITALGIESENLDVIIIQLVRLIEDGKEVKMSKRKGEFITLDDLLEDIGSDVAKYFFLMRDPNTHMDFDLNLAKEQSKKNPVYYIQYAYARLNQIFARSNESGSEKIDISLLKEEEEAKIIRKIIKFPELIEEIALNYQVHSLALYAYELAADFHNFYEKHRVVGDDKDLERARLALCSAVKIVLGQCLSLMGISSPNKM